MTDIKKKDGRREKFDRAKIERSLKKAKVDERTVKEITNKILPKEGMTTDEIRRNVAKELRTRNEKAANQYENTNRLIAKKSIKAAHGRVQLSEETMNRLRLKGGDSINIIHSDESRTLKVERGTLKNNEINLNESDLRNIGASDGMRILVQRRI